MVYSILLFTFITTEFDVPTDHPVLLEGKGWIVSKQAVVVC